MWFKLKNMKKEVKESFDSIFKKINNMTENKEIKSIKFNYDSENNILDIKIVPVKVVEHVTIDFIVTPTGVELNNI